MTNFDKFYKIIYSFKENDTEKDIKIIKKELNISKKDKILDLWVWYWRIFFPLLKEKYNVYWYDNSKYFQKKYFQKNKDRFIFWDFSNISNEFEKKSFNYIYSLYSSIGHNWRKNDEKLFDGISKILKKWWKFLLEYENFVFHTQNNNIFNKTFYDIWDYRRLVDINVDLKNEKINIWNELYSLKTWKHLKKWEFSLEFYTYKKLEEIGEKYWLKLKKIFWRVSREFIFCYETQVFLLFEKI